MKSMGWIDRLVAHKGVAIDSFEHKFKRFWFLRLNGILLGSVTGAALFAYFGCFWTPMFLISLCVLVLCALVHLSFTKKIGGSAAIVTFGLVFSSMAIYWAFGPQRDCYMWNIATIGHSLLMSGLSSKKWGITLGVLTYGVLSVGLLLINGLFLVYGESFTGNEPELPKALWCIYTWFNMLFPWAVQFGTYLVSVRRLEAHQANLATTIAEAEHICKCLLTFDLDGLPPPPAADDDTASSKQILHMLHEVVGRLKKYRPFLPHYLLVPHSVEASPSMETVAVEGEETDIAEGSRDAEGPSDEEGPSTSRPSRGSNSAPISAGLPLPSALARLGKPLQKGQCTVVLIAMAGVGKALAASHDACASATHLSRMFSEAVVNVVARHVGDLLSLSGDQCLAAWNMVSGCPQHVTTALTAALEIRDQLRALLPQSTCQPVMGVWSSEFFSG
jgi:hypothetical protein